MIAFQVLLLGVASLACWWQGALGTLTCWLPNPCWGYYWAWFPEEGLVQTLLSTKVGVLQRRYSPDCVGSKLNWGWEFRSYLLLSSSSLQCIALLSLFGWELSIGTAGSCQRIMELVHSYKWSMPVCACIPSPWEPWESKDWMGGSKTLHITVFTSSVFTHFTYLFALVFFFLFRFSVNAQGLCL